MQIRIDDLQGPEVAALLTEHLECMAEVSPPESRHALNLEALRRPEITFWTVWSGNELAGCGALKELDGTHGEVKSMRTARTHLRQGVASRVLSHIVEEAQRRGYRRLSLETGSMGYFEPAWKLYRKAGFRECAAFGDYRPDANSVFFTREISGEGVSEIEGFIRDFEACTLPKRRWTHHAHLTVALWYLTHHGYDEALEIVRRRIRTYNEATGTANTDSAGYHETLTRLFVRGVADFMAGKEGLAAEVVLEGLLRSPLGDKDWPLGFYSRERLFSVEARRGWVEPERWER